MVFLRSKCEYPNAGNGGLVKETNIHTHDHGANTVVHGDAARSATDHHASARNKGAKSNRALNHDISREDKPKRDRTCKDVQNADTITRPDGRKSTRGTKPRVNTRATKKGCGSKAKVNSNEPSADSADDGNNHACRAGKRGTKRQREDGDAPEDDAGRANKARRIQRRTDDSAPTGHQCDFIPAVLPDNNEGGSFNNHGLRRSARLASKLSIPAHETSPNENTVQPAMLSTKTRRQRARNQEQGETERKASSPRRRTSTVGHLDGLVSGSNTKTERSEDTLVARQLDPSHVDRPEQNEEAPLLSPKAEEFDEDWRLNADVERHMAMGSVEAEYWEDRESTRSPSIESLQTPPPDRRDGELGIVLLHGEFETMIPLDSIPDENEQVDLEREYLRQLQENRVTEDADEDAAVPDIRDRSLAPEPEEGLIVAIRSGRIPGLASPERLIHED